MIKNIFSILKDAINAIKSQKSVRITVCVLWAFYLSYYVFNMLMPLCQAALLDGASSLFSNSPNYFLLIVGVFGLISIKCVIALYRAKVSYLHEKANSEISLSIQSKIYDKLCRISYSVFNSPKIYETIQFISGGYASYCSNFLAGHTLSSLVGTVISFVFTSIVLFKISVPVAIIMICGNLFGIFKTWLESRLNYYAIVENMKDRRYADSYCSSLFERNTVKEIKIYGLIDYILKKWYQYTAKVNRKTLGYNGLFVLIDLITYFIANAFTVAALILTARMILVGKLTIGAFLLVYSSSGSLIDTSGSLFNSLQDLKMSSRYLSKYQEFNSIPDVEPDVQNGVNPVYEQADVDSPLDITFENVSFAYEGSERKAIDGLNLTIRQGEKVAIVGENGCGKSTLVALLNRLYSMDDGEIYVSGIPQKEQLHRLRRDVSTVFQDFGRYETTFRENMNMADINEEYGDEYLWKYAHQTGIDTRIRESEYGLDTPIGRYAEGGINLSGGEWQKLAVTRGLIRPNTKMLIMDEPNAALDPIAEADIYRRVFDAIEDQTLILITHRLGAIKYVDRIVVMENGKVIEDGTHDSLMQLKGKYFEMYTSQAKWYE